MFTGLIEQMGRVAALSRSKGKARIAINATGIPSRLKLGDSVAVSGVCLTAVDLAHNQFFADLADETLKRTSLASLKKGSWVNLEFAVRAQDRIGGHVVQGHVDGVARLLSLTKIKGGEDWRLAIELPAGLERYVVPQGSIAVEGISLTVAGIENTRVEIAIIPHTYKVTNLHCLRPGSPLNIEVDILAKYAEKTSGTCTRGKLTVGELVRRGF